MRVSCIMPTADRPQYVERAIRLFLAQTWESRELLIMDAGVSPVEELIPRDSRIWYLRDIAMPLGMRRNQLCELAKGEVIMHWDDDDWYAPWRITYQVNELLASGAYVNGTDSPIFHRERDNACFQYRWPSPGTGWIHGATMAYWRDHWKRNPFTTGEITDVMEEIGFLHLTAATGHPAVPTRNADWYVGTIHDSNVAPKRVDGIGWIQLGGLPDWVNEVEGRQAED